MLYNDKVEKVLFLQAFFVFLYIIFYSFLYIFTLTYSYFFPILFLKVRRKIRLPTNPRILYNNTSTDLFGHARKQRHGWYICIYFLLNIYSSICIPIPCPNFGRSGYFFISICKNVQSTLCSILQGGFLWTHVSLSSELLWKILHRLNESTMCFINIPNIF